MQEIFLYFSEVGKKCMLNLYYIKGRLNKLLGIRCDLDLFLCSLEIGIVNQLYCLYILDI